MGLKGLICSRSLNCASFLFHHKNTLDVIPSFRWTWVTWQHWHWPSFSSRQRILRLHSNQPLRYSHTHSKSDCSKMAVAGPIHRGDAELEIIKFCQSTCTSGVNKKALNAVVSSGASCLMKGGVIGVPTDTIYGIACLAQNTEAVNQIYEIKQRNLKNPIAISVGTVDDIYKWSKVTVPREILEDLLPGPVTVVFERSPELNPALNPDTRLVGIRIPNHAFMQSLAHECNSPIALTSANISGGSSCLQVEEFRSLWPRLDLIVDGGKLSDTEESRLGSTVVDLSLSGTFRIIRPGSAHQTTQDCLKTKHGLREILPTPSSR